MFGDDDRRSACHATSPTALVFGACPPVRRGSIVPSTVVTGSGFAAPARLINPRCGTAVCPTTPPSATKTDCVTVTPRVIRAQCSHRAAALPALSPLSQILCSSKTRKSFSPSARFSLLCRARMAAFSAHTSACPPSWALASEWTTLTSPLATPLLLRSDAVLQRVGKFAVLCIQSTKISFVSVSRTTEEPARVLPSEFWYLSQSRAARPVGLFRAVSMFPSYTDLRNCARNFTP